MKKVILSTVGVMYCLVVSMTFAAIGPDIWNVYEGTINVERFYELFTHVTFYLEITVLGLVFGAIHYKEDKKMRRLYRSMVAVGFFLTIFTVGMNDFKNYLVKKEVENSSSSVLDVQKEILKKNLELAQMQREENLPKRYRQTMERIDSINAKIEKYAAANTISTSEATQSTALTKFIYKEACALFLGGANIVLFHMFLSIVLSGRENDEDDSDEEGDEDENLFQSNIHEMGVVAQLRQISVEVEERIKILTSEDGSKGIISTIIPDDEVLPSNLKKEAIIQVLGRDVPKNTEKVDYNMIIKDDVDEKIEPKIEKTEEISRDDERGDDFNAPREEVESETEEGFDVEDDFTEENEENDTDNSYSGLKKARWKDIIKHGCNLIPDTLKEEDSMMNYCDKFNAIDDPIPSERLDEYQMKFICSMKEVPSYLSDSKNPQNAEKMEIIRDFLNIVVLTRHRYSLDRMLDRYRIPRSKKSMFHRFLKEGSGTIKRRENILQCVNMLPLHRDLRYYEEYNNLLADGRYLLMTNYKHINLIPKG